MNCYYLVEDKCSGKQIYRAWIKHCFSDLTEVAAIDEIKNNHFYILSGYGYPSYMGRISAALRDIEMAGNIDQFFICIDTEDMSVREKQEEIFDILNQGPCFANSHVVVHNCCMETWFLGHAKMLKTHPEDEQLRLWKRHYDVSRLDPESMECPPGLTGKAQFHYEYVRAMLREQDLRYTKNTPGPIAKPHYLAALIHRYQSTGHIASFGKLIELWSELGAQSVPSS